MMHGYRNQIIAAISGNLGEIIDTHLARTGNGRPWSVKVRAHINAFNYHAPPARLRHAFLPAAPQDFYWTLSFHAWSGKLEGKTTQNVWETVERLFVYTFLFFKNTL